MMKPKLSDLQLNRNLLNRDFQGYQLSLAPVEFTEIQISGVDQSITSCEQFSYLHQREFNMHNHLYWNIWNRDGVYFVDENKNILKLPRNSFISSAQLHSVWTVPHTKPREPGDYNISITFSSPSTAIVGDGIQTVHLLSFEDELNQSWRILTSYQLPESRRGFTVSACRSSSDDNVTCIIRHIEKCKNVTHSRNSSFKNVLSVINFSKEQSGWVSKHSDEIPCRGNIDYLALEPEEKAFYLITSDPGFGQQADTADEANKLKYFWRQGTDDVFIWFDLDEEVTKKDVEVSTTVEKIEVKVNGQALLTGNFHQPIDASLSTWSVTDGKVEITLQKAEASLWTACIDCEVPSEELNEEQAEEAHRQLSHLCSDYEVDPPPTMVGTGGIEECDLLEAESKSLLRFHITENQVSHKILLGGEQLLMTVPTECYKVPAFCMRSDVDGCVWQPEGISESGEWVCQHISNFHAFGYVQASKERRKFTVSPPNRSYAAIVDIDGRVYLFRQGVAINGTLRNRTSCKSSTEKAVQQMVTLPSHKTVLGAIAEDDHMAILTSSYLYVLNILI